jgi:glutamine amidotransferase-like uncharacterized protein
MPNDAPYLDITIGGLERHFSGLDGSFKRSVRIGLQRNVSTDSLRMGRVDLEIIVEKLREHPDGIQTLLEAFLGGNNEEVVRLLEELGLREADFQSRGGGIFWAIVIVGVLCCASEAR